MIHGLISSPASYFDVTSSGQLNSAFSNDLGIMDNVLIPVLIDSIEGPIISIILLINVIIINFYFIIPAVIIVTFLVVGFIYCKNSMVAVKLLDLKLKIPIFNMVNEIISSLTQVRIY